MKFSPNNTPFAKRQNGICDLMTTEKDNTKLIELLDKSQHLARQFSGAYSGQIFSAEEFHLALVDSISKRINGHNSQLDKLNIWFVTTRNSKNEV